VFIPPDAGSITLEEYATRFREVQAHRPSTALNYEVICRVHIAPGLGRYRLAEIRQSHVKAWMRERSAVMAPSSLRVAFKILRAILRAAVADRLISFDPSEGVKAPPVPRRKAEPLTLDQLDGLAEVVPARYRGLVTVAATTGLREGELLGLQVEDLDLLGKVLHVRRQLVLIPGAPPYLAVPKTEGSVRDVPLGLVAVEALAAHLAAFGAVEGFVFTNEAGLPIRRNRLSGLWAQWRKASGLPAGARFHDLRHSFVSALIEGGASVTLVSELIGHSSPAVTLGVYSHLFPSSGDVARDAIDRHFRPVEVSLPLTGSH
jgi:integrase